MITIRKVTAWETSDGEKHSSHAMAEHHIQNIEMVELITDRMSIDRVTAQDLLNTLSNARSCVRIWLDGIDKMEQEAMRS
jgi:hypothetical protein